MAMIFSEQNYLRQTDQPSYIMTNKAGVINNNASVPIVTRFEKIIFTLYSSMQSY